MVMLKYITSRVITLLIGFEKVAEDILSKQRSDSKARIFQEDKIVEREHPSRKPTMHKLGQAWWLMLIIPALWEAGAGRSLEVRSLKPAWPT